MTDREQFEEVKMRKIRRAGSARELQENEGWQHLIVPELNKRIDVLRREIESGDHDFPGIKDRLGELRGLRWVLDYPDQCRRSGERAQEKLNG